MKNKITFSELLAGLSNLKIKYELVGEHKKNLFFCSLRRIETGGIFFIEDGVPKSAENIENSVLICKGDLGLSISNTYVFVRDPQLTFYKLMQLFQPCTDSGEIHPTAIIDTDAVLGDGVSVGPFSVVGASVIKSGTKLSSHVVIENGSEIGSNCEIGSHTTIGATGVAWIWDAEARRRIVQPQTGGCIVGDNVYIGTNVTIVRGSVNESTFIGDGTMIAHGTKIGHGCVIGRDNHFANSVSLAGNVETGLRVFFGSGAVVRPMVKIADDTVVGAGAVVVSNINQKNSLATGVPAIARPQEKQKLSGVPKPLESAAVKSDESHKP